MDLPFIGPFPCGTYTKAAIAAVVAAQVYASPTFSLLVPRISQGVVPASLATPLVHAIAGAAAVDMLCRGPSIMSGAQEMAVTAGAGMAGAYILAGRIPQYL